jgi:hypothetical protein
MAHAADTWTAPFPGVARLYRTTSAPLRIHALAVDLCAPGVAVRATASDERGQKTSAFGGSVKAEAAVNGDFFSAGYTTSGFAMGDGASWPNSKDGTSEGFLAFGPKVAFFSPPSDVAAAPAGTTEIVSGRPQVLVAGEVPSSFSCSTHYCDPNPRTGFGFSRDRRTLFLVVVDGRSDVSVGVTTKGLGDIFASLGAWDATNLDGGGSSTMWLAGKGVVNVPSDGSERVVANHLAVQSNGLSGAGSAVSCVESPLDELLASAHELDGLGSSDIDGDGKADLCARAAAGFRCHPSTGQGFGEGVVIAELSDDAGFVGSAYHSTIRMADIDGDGLADVCARAAEGVLCWRSTGTGFTAAVAGPELTDEGNWDEARYGTTIRLADIDGDQRADLCARYGVGLRCHRSTGDGFEQDALELPELSDEQGWDTPERFGSLRMADIDGDGRVDVCGRAAEGVRCWRSTGDGFSEPIQGPEWSDDLGWGAMSAWSTIRLADMDGDGRADLCARAADGVRCHLSTGEGFGSAVLGPELSDDSGWADQANYLTFRIGDIDGDARGDLCARADAGIRCWRWTGEGFGEGIAGPTLSDESGWYTHRYFRTLRLADIDGDGKSDLCARAAKGTLCWRSQGDSFSEPLDGPEWSDEKGWGKAAYYTTIRAAGPPWTNIASSSSAAGGGAAGSGGSGIGGSGGGVADPATVNGRSEDGSTGCGCRIGEDVPRTMAWQALVLLAAAALLRSARVSCRRGRCNHR